MDHGQFHAAHMPEMALSPPGTPKAGAGAGAGAGLATPTPYAMPKGQEVMIQIVNPLHAASQ